jgi:molecular chaperone DnaK
MEALPPKSLSGVLGLDAGTTRWVLWDEHGVVKDPLGDTTTPAFIGWANGRFVFGTVARAKAVKYPHMTYYDLKRLLGVKYSKGLDASYPFPLFSTADGKVLLRLGEQEYFPQDLLAKMMKYLVDNAELVSGSPYHWIVVTVPAAHGHLARRALLDACQMAGLNVLRCISEPTAAGINLVDMINLQDGHLHWVLIFDLGSV